MHESNLLDTNSSTFTSTTLSGVGNWVAEDGDLARTSRRYFRAPASLYFTYTGINGGDGAAISGSGSSLIPIDTTTEYRAFCWLHHEIPLREIRFGIQFYDSEKNETTYSYTDVEMGFNEWTLASKFSTSSQGDSYAAIRVELLSVDTGNSLDGFLWLDQVAFVEVKDFINDTFVKQTARWIPEYVLLADKAQSNPQYPLQLLIDIAGADFHSVISDITDFGYYDVGDPDKPNATSILVDPNGFPGNGTQPEWLTWLGQLTGLRSWEITDGSDGTTSWFSLEDLYTNWTSWEDTLNDAVLGSAVSLSQIERTDGVALATSSADHGFNVGDVVNMVISTDVTFSGYYEILDVPSDTTFTYSQTYLISQLSQAGTTTVTVTTSRSHALSIGDKVILSGTGTVHDGERTVTGTSSSTVFTFTAGSSATVISYFGYAYPKNTASPITTGTRTATPAADLTWNFVEGANAFPLTSNEALVQFIVTGASGIWAGTVEGIKRAARIPVIGFDGSAVLERSDGVVTATTSAPHGFSVGQEIEIYASPEITLNRTGITVDSIVDDYVFTYLSGGRDQFSRGRVTNKIVTVDRQRWNGIISQISISSGTAIIEFTEKVPTNSLDDGLVISGTSNSSVNGEFPTPVIVLASDRMSISFNTSGLGMPSTFSESPAFARAKLNTQTHFCLTVNSLTAQTTGPDVVIEFANYAKPAGGIITHDYI
jgi:hypothetical protein